MKTYRVVEPIKYGHHPFGVGSKVEMEANLGDKLCADGVLETWPETEVERAARLNAEMALQADLQRAERELAERELAERRARESEDSKAATPATSPQAGGSAGAPALPSVDDQPHTPDTPQQSGGSDEASRSEAQDSQDAQSGTQDGTGAGAVDASAPKSESGKKKSTGKK